MESILATCGGHCECATCHVHLAATATPPPAITAPAGDRKPIGVPQEAPVDPMTDEEEEQLDFALGRDASSRLSCQIAVTKQLGEWCERGGRIGLPQY